MFGWLHEQLTGNHYYERHYKLKAGDVVVDAGAGPCGVFTVFAAKAVGERGLVIAIEPERNNLENLKENIKINNLENVIVISKGARALNYHSIKIGGNRRACNPSYTR